MLSLNAKDVALGLLKLWQWDTIALLLNYNSLWSNIHVSFIFAVVLPYLPKNLSKVFTMATEALCNQ
jgi:hypothetical protein